MKKPLGSYSPELVAAGFALEVDDAPLLHHWLNVADLVPLVTGANATGANAYNLFLDEIDLRLFGNTMGADTRNVLRNFLIFSMAGSHEHLKILSTVHLATMSPEFLVQR